MSALAIPAGVLLKVGSAVIEKWSTWRRNQFYESFLQALQIEQASGQIDPQVDTALDYLLENDVRSEVLYDAFRRVCYTKSRKYGPRIIGLLAGRLVNEALTANEEEEQCFAAAERLGDAEIVEFANHYRSLLSEAADPLILKRKVMRSGDQITQIYSKESHEVGGNRSEAHLTPISPWEAFGSWAGQLVACGMLDSTLTQETNLVKEDSERYIDYDQTWTTYITSFTYNPPCKMLFDLYERARNFGGGEP